MSPHLDAMSRLQLPTSLATSRWMLQQLKPGAVSQLWVIMEGLILQTLAAIAQVQRGAVEHGSSQQWMEYCPKVLDHALREACGVTVFPDEVPTSAMILISGLTVVADRLVSAHEWVKQSQARCQTAELNLTQPKEWILAQAEPALARIREQLGIYSDWPSAEDALEAILQGYEPRPAQREAMSDPDGLFTIMSATGSGKTEAAILRHAQRKERMLFLLPTMATSNALMKRVQRTFSSTQTLRRSHTEWPPLRISTPAPSPPSTTVIHWKTSADSYQLSSCVQEWNACWPLSR